MRKAFIQYQRKTCLHSYSCCQWLHRGRQGALQYQGTGHQPHQPSSGDDQDRLQRYQQCQGWNGMLPGHAHTWNNSMLYSHYNSVLQLLSRSMSWVIYKKRYTFFKGHIWFPVTKCCNTTKLRVVQKWVNKWIHISCVSSRGKNRPQTNKFCVQP